MEKEVLDLGAPVTLGAILQAVTPLIAAVAFLIALRGQWRSLTEQRLHDREVADSRMGALEGSLKAAIEELRLMREALVTVGNQNMRIGFLEKTIDEVKRGVGLIRPAQGK